MSRRSRKTDTATPKPCTICYKAIVDGEEEAFLCEGGCQKLLHCSCAGLSAGHFTHLSNTSNSFLCINCAHKAQKTSVSLLQTEVATLKAEIVELCSLVEALRSADNDAISTLTSSVKQLDERANISKKTNCLEEDRSTSNSLQVVNHTCTCQPQSVPSPKQHSKEQVQVPKTTTSMSERKFNIIIHCVPEMPNGNSHFIRHRNDLGEASPIISALNEDTDGHPCSIGDCYRLGKYDSSKSRSRPLLVSLNSIADVHNILSNR